MLADLLCEQKETRKIEKSWDGGSCKQNITGKKNQNDFLELKTKPKFKKKGIHFLLLQFYG